MALARLTGLRLAPDGSWLAVTVSALAPDGRTFKPSIWRVDTGPAARPGAARLTWSAEGEDSPRSCRTAGWFSCLPPRPAGRPPGRPGLPRSGPPPGPVTGPEPDARRPGRSRGRPGPRQERGPDPAGQRALWLLPAAGGEACRVVAPPGGVSRLATAAARAGRVHRAGAARRQRGRRGRAAAPGPCRRRRDGHPARDAPGPVLGPRSRPGRAAAPGHRRAGRPGTPGAGCGAAGRGRGGGRTRGT